MYTDFLSRFEKPYRVYDYRKDEMITVLAPSPLGALYNANIAATGRIPDEPLWQGEVTIALGDFQVKNEYL